jgi:hypothetical protein
MFLCGRMMTSATKKLDRRTEHRAWTCHHFDELLLQSNRELARKMVRNICSLNTFSIYATSLQDSRQPYCRWAGRISLVEAINLPRIFRAKTVASLNPQPVTPHHQTSLFTGGIRYRGFLMRRKNHASAQKDALRPSKRESSKMLARSRRTWGALHLTAHSAAHYPSSCSNIGNLLHQMPSIPDQILFENVEGDNLSLEGHSQWRIDSSVDCDLTNKSKHSHPYKVHTGLAFPNFCSVTEESSGWLGFEQAKICAPRTNYVCALTLGWSYVLSARLIELQKITVHDKVCYTNEKASSRCHNAALFDDGFMFPVGSADADERRWWAAILARGRGWRANLRRSGKEYNPPWACHLDPETNFNFCFEGPTNEFPCSNQPPSSGEAHQYLLKFAILHHAVDQLVAAFAASLTLPSHLRFGAPIVLPKPRLISTTRKLTSEYVFHPPCMDQLPQCMFLTCISNAVSSCLFSCFWEHRVDCNLVSEWLNPIVGEILPPLIRNKKYETIVGIMAARQPNLAPLWLSCAMTGLLPRILSISSSYMPTPFLEAAIWTQSRQSFMDPDSYRHSRALQDVTRGVITREDEFRLLYLTDITSEHFGSPPLSPYPPFGVVNMNQTALDVRLHASCGHSFSYDCWIWRQRDGQCMNDFGISAQSRPNSCGRQLSIRGSLTGRISRPLIHFYTTLLTFWKSVSVVPGRLQELAFDERLSEVATRNVFSWTFFSEGIRSDELPLWNHEWLQFLLERESDNGDGSVCSDSTANE